MKKCKNKLLTAILVLTTLFVFSSCEEERTVSSSLDCNLWFQTDRNGNFENGRVYDIEDLSNVRYSDIVGMEYLGSSLTISGQNLRYGDVIRDLYIDIDGLEPFPFAKSIPILRDGEVITFTTNDDREFYDFMREAMYLFYSRGEMDLIIYGYLTSPDSNVNGVNIKITLSNLVDVRIRD